jgi:hypothetical protein
MSGGEHSRDDKAAIGYDVIVPKGTDVFFLIATCRRTEGGAVRRFWVYFPFTLSWTSAIAILGL